MIEEDRDEIPLGIVSSMILFGLYTYVLNKFFNRLLTNEINNSMLIIIYFIPFIILYIGVPILLRKSHV